MIAKTEDIRRWFQNGVEIGSTHLIVVNDTFNWSDYPVQVSEDEDVEEVAKKYHYRMNMQKVMEVYDLSVDMEMQIKEHRAFHGVNSLLFR
ncbi:MAG: hypothetical protein CMG78_11955 [Marinobacter sp.]|nr:hypothetical protein [Marinobacter sp.]